MHEEGFSFLTSGADGAVAWVIKFLADGESGRGCGVSSSFTRVVNNLASAGTCGGENLFVAFHGGISLFNLVAEPRIR